MQSQHQEPGNEYTDEEWSTELNIFQAPQLGYMSISGLSAEESTFTIHGPDIFVDFEASLRGLTGSDTVQGIEVSYNFLAKDE